MSEHNAPTLKDFQALLNVIKQQQAIITQHQAAFNALVVFLENSEVTSRDEFDRWITTLKRIWPDKYKIDDKENHFDWLLTRPSDPIDDDPGPGKPGWIPQVIPGGRPDDSGD